MNAQNSENIDIYIGECAESFPAYAVRDSFYQAGDTARLAAFTGDSGEVHSNAVLLGFQNPGLGDVDILKAVLHLQLTDSLQTDSLMVSGGCLGSEGDSTATIASGISFDGGAVELDVTAILKYSLKCPGDSSTLQLRLRETDTLSTDSLFADSTASVEFHAQTSGMEQPYFEIEYLRRTSYIRVSARPVHDFIETRNLLKFTVDEEHCLGDCSELNFYVADHYGEKEMEVEVERTGDGGYRFDAQAHKVSSGRHLLVVENQRNEHRYLSFYVNK